MVGFDDFQPPPLDPPSHRNRGFACAGGEAGPPHSFSDHGRAAPASHPADRSTTPKMGGLPDPGDKSFPEEFEPPPSEPSPPPSPPGAAVGFSSPHGDASLVQQLLSGMAGILGQGGSKAVQHPAFSWMYPSRTSVSTTLFNSGLK